MANPFTLARVWRILKEVDLEAIRREAEKPVRLLVMAETAADADDLAVLLAGDQADAAQWITAVDARLAAEQATTRVAPASAPKPAVGPASVPAEAVVDGPDVILVVTRGRDLSPALETARQIWLDRKARLVTVALDDGGRVGKVRTQGSLARVAVAGLDTHAVSAVAQALFSIVRPDERLALGRELPGLRACVFDELISETARANAGYAFSTGLAEIVPLLDVPLNIGDMIVLTKNQLVMGYRLALTAGKQGRPTQLIGEIVGVLGGGLIFRQLARQLIGLVPVIGIVPKVAVAYGGTWAIGRAVVLWAQEGHKLTGARLKELTREGMTRGRAVAHTMKRRTPAA